MDAVYLGDKRVLVKTKWNGRFILSTEDFSLTPNLLCDGFIEPELTNYIIQTVRPGHVVFDVGANIGYFTVLMQRLVGRQGKVIAYEANPFVFDLLMQNAQINFCDEVGRSVHLLNKAVYSRATNLTLFATRRFQGNSSLKPHPQAYFDAFSGDSTQPVSVSAEPLDMYYGTYDHIHLLKLDVEGAEYEAFLGMERLLRNGIIDTLVFEVNQTMLGDDMPRLMDLLQTYEQARPRYQLALIHQSGELVPVTAEQIRHQEFLSSVVMKRVS
ncbi:MAG: FkbM family methyltransferase [Alicyclobacillus sp.]|nr:FkbM family methyltransferase [Alicyclobacillus sp.]